MESGSHMVDFSYGATGIPIRDSQPIATMGREERAEWTGRAPAVACRMCYMSSAAAVAVVFSGFGLYPSDDQWSMVGCNYYA